MAELEGAGEAVEAGSAGKKSGQQHAKPGQLGACVATLKRLEPESWIQSLGCVPKDTPFVVYVISVPLGAGWNVSLEAPLCHLPS